KGSIRAATEVLLRLANVKLQEIEAVYIAGAFGSYIPKASAIRIGLLPPLPLDIIESVGNAAGMGAKLALLSERERRRAEEIARTVEHVELGTNPIYANAFFEAMAFSTA
ncbi:MAG TPA: DUF4445 domain-containing protein, partial [Armatimonadetes bacterium]|nr:DUF4445 domain-containing protein [Armatimonadota bacterium]